MPAHFYVYILTNDRRTVLYVGMTNDLERRIWQHRTGEPAGFTSRYQVKLLVHVEEFPTAVEARARERMLKGWLRHKKQRLIQENNPAWRDLAAGWYDDLARDDAGGLAENEGTI